MEAAARLTQLRSQAYEEASGILARAQQWPQFAEYRDRIRAAMEANPALSVADAYLEQVLPTLLQTAQTQQAQQGQRKLTATTEHPGRSVPLDSRPDREKSIEQLLREQAPAFGFGRR